MQFYGIQHSAAPRSQIGWPVLGPGTFFRLQEDAMEAARKLSEMVEGSVFVWVLAFSLPGEPRQSAYPLASFGAGSSGL